MNILNSFFREVYCINLDRRTDRWEKALVEFNRIELEVKRFPAIDSLNIRNPTSISDGAYGCALSHLSIIKSCLERNVENVLIFEDDVVIEDAIIDVFVQEIHNFKNWDMIYFGGYQIIPPKYISNNLFKIKGCYANHAYGINNSMYSKILDICSDVSQPIDVCISKIQSENNCFLLKDNGKSLTYQYPDYSDIEKRFVDYRYIL